MFPVNKSLHYNIILIIFLELTGITVSFPPTKNNPKPLFSLAISIVVSIPGTIGHVSGSAGGSKINDILKMLVKY